jgi:hypothetical protein
VIPNTDQLLETLLGKARKDPSHPVSSRLLTLHQALRDGNPWPTEWAGRRTEDVPLDGQARDAWLSAARDDLLTALVIAWADARVTSQDVATCPACRCTCGQPHIPPAVEHYAAAGGLCDDHADRQARAARYDELANWLTENVTGT